jgi:drug/metabolite transporter (DMT)-like permease
VTGVLLVLAAATSWGTWSLFLKKTDLPPQVTTLLLFAVMGLLTLPLALRQPRVRWDRRLAVLVLANGAFDLINVIAFFAAMRCTTVAIAVLTHYVTPILVALLAGRIDGESPHGARGAALVALAGLAIVLEPWHEPASGVVTGALLGLLSACGYAGNVFVVRRVAERLGAVRAMSYHSLVAAVLVLPFGASDLVAAPADDLTLVLIGASTVGAIAGVAFVAGLRRIGSARAAILAFAEPLVAVAVSALKWDEPLHALAAVGGALVLGAGVYVARGGPNVSRVGGTAG